MTATEEKAHRLRPYPSYKDSGVEWIGEIPENWDMRRFKDVMILNPRKSERALPAEVSFVPMEAVSEDGLIDASTTRNTVEVQVGYTYFTEGDLLIAKVTPCFENGKGAVATQLCNGVGFGSTEFHVLRGTQSMSATYAYYLTMADGFRKLGESSMYGAGGQKRVSTNFMREVVIPKPPAEEQQAIVAFLDRETERIDELMREQEALLDDLNAKKEAVLSRTISLGLNSHTETKPTGNDFIPFIPAEWNIKRLKQISPQQTVGVVVNPTSYVENDGTVPFLLGSNVKEMGFKTDNVVYISKESNKELQKTCLRAGDIVTVRVGAPGVTAVISEELDGCNCASVMIIRQHPSFDSTWLAYAMNSRVGRAQVEVVQYGAAQKQFNISHAVDFFFPVPPFEEQQAIAAYLDGQLAQIDELREEVRANIEDMRIHRSALITAAVTGKIDVREAE